MKIAANIARHFGTLAGVCFLLLASSAHAVLLDWTAVSWSKNTLNNSYDVDSTNPGNDIKLTVGGDTGLLKGGFPVDDNQLTGGISGSQSLHLKADFANNSQALTVTIDFNYSTWLANGVENVSFSIFNLDTDGSYIDQIRGISAVNTSGATVAATVTGGSAATISGSGTAGATASGNANIANNSGAGNITIDFGTNIITSVTFTYGNDASASSTPKVQDISVYNVSFTKHAIPEVSVPAIAMGACALALLLRRRASKRGVGSNQ